MNITSPTTSTPGTGGSHGAGGMGWLLDTGPPRKSSASLLSLSGSNNSNYSSVNANNAPAADNEGLRGPASTEMLRTQQHSSSIPSIPSIPELAYSYPDPPRSSPPRPRPHARIDLPDVLSQSVRACTSTIFGLYGLEIWKLDGSGSLINVPIKSPNVADLRSQSSGLFVRRVTQEADYESPDFSSSARDAFERLTDTTRLDHISVNTTAPGVGLAGALWSEVSRSNALAAVQSGVQSISENIHRRVSLLTGLYSPASAVPASSCASPALSHDADCLLWREVDALAKDPDQPHDERLQLLAKAGFKLAAGIPFNVREFSGIVIFYANPRADAQKLRDPDNSQLIQFAAQFIGAAAAVQDPIEKAVFSKQKRPKTNWNRLRAKILAVVRFRRPITVRRRGRSRSVGSPTMQRVHSFYKGVRRVSSFAMSREASLKLLSEATDRVQKSFEDVRKAARKSAEDVQYASKAKGMKWWQKAKGGHASNPPPFNLAQCMWTFGGVWITHSTLMWLDYFVGSARTRQSILGPLGALTTLTYNLTSAPASQPRNAFFSQIVALSVCHFLHQIQDLDRRHRCALAPALVAMTTARLGIIHPPAGAASVVFSVDLYGPEDMVIFLGGVCIAIFTAVVINNLSDKRQYPSTNWMVWND